VSAFLFLLRAYPDVDHLVPLAWKVLDQGGRALAVFERPFPARQDYRLRFLARYPGFELLELSGIASPDYLRMMAGRLRWRGRRLRRLLETRQVGTVIVDWGGGTKDWSGLGERLPRLRDRHAWRRALQHPFVRFRLVADYIVPPFRAALISAARALGLPVFCLPHGVQVRITPKAPPRGRLEDPPFEDGRRTFTACVFPSEHERQLQLRRIALDPALSHAWGSMRFSPEWAKILRDICPPAGLPPCREGQIRVVFILPQWIRRVDEEETLALLRSLAARLDVQLILRGHARPGRGDLPGAPAEELLARSNVVLTEAHAPALIGAADAVIVVNSSVSLEALLQGKPLIYPAYLHENRLVFDELGGCLRAAGPADVHRFLDAIAAGAPPAVDPAEVARVLRTVVYAGREPFDVLAHYYAEIRGRMRSVTLDSLR
jgi:hypothetical protein